MAAKDDEKTIGEGIKFVHPSLLEEEEKRIAEEKVQRRRQQRIEKTLAQEAYEKEIQEQQYKALMHLLSKSKTFSKFMLSKFDEEPTKGQHGKRRKSKNDEENDNRPPPAKRGRTANSKTSNAKPVRLY